MTWADTQAKKDRAVALAMWACARAGVTGDSARVARKSAELDYLRANECYEAILRSVPRGKR